MGLFGKENKITITDVKMSISCPTDEELRAQARKSYSESKKTAIKKPKAAQQSRAEFTRQTSERSLAEFRVGGVNSYVIRTVGDGRVCDACKKQNGKKYKTKDAVIGTNAPPFCEECRCIMLPIYKGMKMLWG